MSPISFVPNSGIVLFGQPLTITGVRNSEQRTELEVLDAHGVVHVKSMDYLLDQYQKGNLRAKAPLIKPGGDPQRISNASLKLASDLDEDSREAGKRNAGLLQAVFEEGGFGRGNSAFWRNRFPALCETHGFGKVLNRTTIQRWRKKTYGTDAIPLLLTLAPKNDLKGGRGKIRISEAANQIVESCLQDVYLSNENTPLTDCHDELVRRIHLENSFLSKLDQLKCPTYGQLRRYLIGLDASEVYASRFGREMADTRFRLSRKVTHRFRRALERVEVDHTPLDIFVVSDACEVLGRAYLTLVVDKASRAILGFNLGHEGPSTISVLRALKHSVSPKTYLKTRYPEVVADWPMHGLIELLAMDNGTEFHSPKFKLTILDMQIAREFAYMPRRKAYFKGLVELTQKYLNLGVASGQPGATMSHHWQRNKERPPEDYAVHTLESLSKLLHIWICDVYHQEVQNSLGSSPYVAWKGLTSQMPVRLPASKQQLDLACTISITRTVQAYGVEVCYLRTFNSDELGKLMRKHMHNGSIQVEVRYKPYKLDKVWVKDPGTTTWFAVENYDPETRNSSEWQEGQIQKTIRNSKHEHGLVISRAEAKQKLRAIGQELVNAKTMSRRRMALKLLGLLPSVDLIDEPTVLPKPLAMQPKKSSTRRGRQIAAPAILIKTGVERENEATQLVNSSYSEVGLLQVA